MKTVAANPKTLPARGTAERIAAVAAEILLKEGAAAVSMRRIAESLGITPMAIYHHYESREALLQTIVYEELARLNTMAQRLTEAPDTLAYWIKVGDGYLNYALERPHMFDFVFVAARRQDVRYPDGFRARRSPSLTPLADTIAAAMEEGVLRRDDMWETAMQLWAHTHGYVTLYRSGWFELSEAEFRALHHRAMRRLLEGLLNPKRPAAKQRRPA
ncbi:MAG TPA: TetR/AcrR family transcriptional regulator [Caulobacterales bacterium]|nr:TetR/AcrR family transcriptional regulator [Caulobacterales bacterium]